MIVVVLLLKQITRLKLWQFRNFTDLTLDFDGNTTLMVGQNGAGKTAILESIWLLSRGRSFRTHRLSHLHHQKADTCAIHLTLDTNGHTQQFGWSHQKDHTQLKVNGNPIASHQFLTQCLPVLLISPDQQRWLLEDPKHRRQLMDWVLYYAEPQFYPLWQQYQRVLKQRNQLLKQSVPTVEMQFWNQQLADLGQQLNQFRQTLLTVLEPTVNQQWSQLTQQSDTLIQLQLKPGWRKQTSLMEALAQQWESDQRLGFTQSGAHRADLIIQYQQQDWKYHLSRGQQKLLAMSLTLSMAQYLSQAHQIPPFILVDDMISELDEKHQSTSLLQLQSAACQTLLTSPRPFTVDFPTITL